MIRGAILLARECDYFRVPYALMLLQHWAVWSTFVCQVFFSCEACLSFWSRAAHVWTVGAVEQDPRPSTRFQPKLVIGVVWPLQTGESTEKKES